MPFVQRVVNPVFIARKTPHSNNNKNGGKDVTDGQEGTSKSGRRVGVGAGGSVDNVPHHTPVEDNELEAVTNRTLSNALRQLASLVLIANDIFMDLNKELRTITERSTTIKVRITALVEIVDSRDAKLVTVPESDLTTFVQIRNHYKSQLPITTSLFTRDTRTPAIQELYDAAALTPVHCMDELDRLLGRSDRTSSEIFLCTPILGQSRKRMRRNIDVEIETRLPSAIEDLRKWTSLEAIGDVTVTPDCASRVNITVNGSALNSTVFSNDVAGTSHHRDNSGTLLSITPPSPLSPSSNDETDIVTVISNSYSRHQLMGQPEPSSPLDHRLPSPEEQCQTLASKFPPELVRMDITGRRFDRMSVARKSMIQLKTTTLTSGSSNGWNKLSAGPSPPTSSGTPNDEDEIEVLLDETAVVVDEATGEVQTVRRRSRTRKPRGRRRNTLAGTDQREIEEAATAVNGDPSTASSSATNTMKSGDLGDAPETMIDDLLIPLHKFHRAKQQQQQQQQQQQLQNQQPPRSKSSDILKNNMSGGDLSATGKSQTFSSHFNSLKQWGKNRLRMKVRGMEQHQQQQQQQFNSDQNQQQMQLYSSMVTFANQNNSNNGHGDGMAKKVVSDIDNGFNGQAETAAGGSSSTRRRPMDRALSHERKPSYSSSERSLPLSISSHTTATTSSPTLPASINPVKMRESAAIRRQRRIGLGYKEEPNNSSSGNWSASSESGRTSIGSEITVQPKSSASSQSLNHMNHHPGSGPPSSVISRRRFFNTSASSSVTSEGTATPEQMQELMFDDMETSSAYSCDTEGYYTSFHVDSGLKTLKEEEPSTPLHVSSALSSTNSFSSGNQTVVENENEYELFGRGSTSTTASSAGTICTMLMGGGGSDRSSIGGGGGPMVPERKSSLTKLNRSNSTTSSSNRNSMEPLERSRSSSTMGSASTLDRMGTIKRNGVLLPKEISVVIKSSATAAAAVATTGGTTKGDVRLDSPDSGNNTSTSPVESNSNSISPPALRSGSSEFEYSESSDQETMDRSERIRTKTTINSSRIPSMCVITPSNSSDDETTIRQEIKSPSPPPPSTKEVRAKLATPLSEKRKKMALIETDLDQLDYQTPPTTVIVNDLKKDQVQHVKKTTLLPLNNVLGRLKGVIPHLNRKSPLKSPGGSSVPVPAEQIYDVAGEYVTISDANRRGTGGYYANAKTVKNNLAAVLSGRQLNDETEYVSLNELPSNIRCERPLANEQNSSTSTKSSNLLAPSPSSSTTRGAAAAAAAAEASNNNNNKALGARVTLDAQGKVIYNSDSLKRRKGAHTTFAPGPCVKESATATATADNENNNGVQLRTPVLGRPERRVSLERNGATAAENPPPSPKVDNHRISANRNIILAGLIKHPGGGCGGSGGAVPVSANNSLASVSEVGTDKGQQTTTPTYHSTTLKSFSQPAATATPLLSPLEEDEGLHLLKMIPNSMGPLKNSGAYSTLPKLSSSSSGSGSGSALASPQPGNGSGYQPLYHNPGMTQQQQPQDHRVPLPSERTIAAGRGQQQQQQPQPPHRQNLTFQRSNNIYWTLQLKNRPPAVVPPTTPRQQQPANIEDLYSTPNKLTKTPRTPASGFSTFFRSPANTLNTSSTTTTVTNDSITEPISPINPRNIMDSSDASLLTSTPTGEGRMGSSNISSGSPAPKPKLSEELRNKLKLHSGSEGIRSHGNSPSNSGRSTPRGLVDQQQQPRGRHSWANDSVEIPRTCSDRMGTPKTSLMDFKKLLLSKSAGRTGKSTSAVEQLLVKKPNSPVPGAQPEDIPKPSYNNKAMNLSTLKIQDLSGSPKTFANRRMIRAPGNFNSPGRGMLGAGKSIAAPVAAIKAVKHDIMSTSIPEDHSEEENSPRTPPPQQQQQQQLRHQSSEESCSPTSPPSPAPTTGVISESVNLKENFFLKTEENNFPRNEILQRVNQGIGGGGLNYRKQQMHQQRQQFMGNLGYNNNNQFAQNRNLSKVGGTLSAIAENQIVGVQQQQGDMSNETGMNPSKAPSLETSF